MTLRKIKNLLVGLGYVTTLLYITSTPHLVRWFVILYVIYVVTLWLGNNEEDTH